eukprot:TRINITY_DN757_c0_g1_i1.p1 TRINITY_DN757_c0_g1~~TRINITY_DN757_c0_g1_i1.p1  ORF type:complete len:349 (+),score=67.01 TRINITY_DN757_c0_g1_i1:356-1402(+)
MVAGIKVDCPKESYSFDASTGVLDISKDMADPSDCFAKASAQDGGSTFTFTFDGSSTIQSKNSKWGAIDLTESKCSTKLQAPRVAAPPVGKAFCGGVPGILKSNITVLSATTMEYHNNIMVAGINVDCPKENFVYDAATGVLDISKDMADPSDCFAKASAQDGGSKFTFTYDGTKITSKNSKWGAIDLKPCSSVERPQAVAAPPVGKTFCGGVPGILKSNITVLSATALEYHNDIMQHLHLHLRRQLHHPVQEQQVGCDRPHRVQVHHPRSGAARRCPASGEDLLRRCSWYPQVQHHCAERVHHRVPQRHHGRGDQESPRAAPSRMCPSPWSPPRRWARPSVAESPAS